MPMDNGSADDSYDPLAAAREAQLRADGELVKKARKGDRGSFDVLIDQYQQQAMSVSYRLLGNSADAQEVVQDSFLKAYQNLEQLEKPGAFAGWLMRIVSNLSLNKRRGRGLRKGVSLDVEDAPGVQDDIGTKTSAGESLRSGEHDPLRSAMGKETGVALEAALQQLPEKQRLALLMFAVEGLPQKDVAEALDCSVEAVKWHVFQARKRLRELLANVM
jgi:RNA polymerase sigma-70 factor, ECF subfamily